MGWGWEPGRKKEIDSVCFRASPAGHVDNEVRGVTKPTNGRQRGFAPGPGDSKGAGTPSCCFCFFQERGSAPTHLAQGPSVAVSFPGCNSQLSRYPRLNGPSCPEGNPSTDLSPLPVSLWLCCSLSHTKLGRANMRRSASAAPVYAYPLASVPICQTELGVSAVRKTGSFSLA